MPYQEQPRAVSEDQESYESDSGKKQFSVTLEFLQSRKFPSHLNRTFFIINNTQPHNIYNACSA